jgi:lipoyl(octanoyl) transferase
MFTSPSANPPPSLRGAKRRSNPIVHAIDLGTEPYSLAYQRQLDQIAAIKNNSASETLFLVEHPDVYTFGRKSKILPGHLKNVFEVERGGEATFHNPGQLVAYPLLKLIGKECDLHWYLRKLEDTLIDVLAKFGIEAEARKGATGVWVKGQEKKIASIGVAVRHWITFHGVALNVSNDLSGFSQISPCGFSAEVMTSMQRELGEQCPSLAEVKSIFLESFEAHFDRTIFS